MSMNSRLEPESHDPLLDAVLCDESWESASAGLKVQALRTFQTRRRLRSLARWTTCAAALAVALTAAVHWHAPPAHRLMAVGSSPLPSTPPRARYLTDQELLASFPKGSCFLAEVDGKKVLVFLDPDVERTYVASESPCETGPRDPAP